MLIHRRFPHEIISCQKRCSRTLKCGHPCTQACYLECESDCECIIVEQATQPLDYAQAIKPLVTPPEKENPSRYSRSSSPEKKNKQQPPTQPIEYAQAIKTLVTPLGKENQDRYFRSSSPEKKDQAPQNSSQSRGPAQETQLFRDFASGGHVESDKNLRALAERESAAARHRKLDTEHLISFDDATDKEILAKNLDNVKLVRTKSNGQGGTRGVWKGTCEVPRSENASPKRQQEGSLLDL